MFSFVKCFVCINENNFFEFCKSSANIQYWQSEHTGLKNDQKGDFTVLKIVFYENNQKQQSWLGFSSRPLIDFFYQLLSFSWTSLIAFRNSTNKSLLIQFFVWELCVVQYDTFCFHQNIEKGLFYKKLCIYIIDLTAQDKKIASYLQLGMFWKFSTSFDNFYFFKISVSVTLVC